MQTTWTENRKTGPGRKCNRQTWIKSATTVNIVELNTETESVCLKIEELQSEDHDLRHVIACLDSK